MTYISNFLNATIPYLADTLLTFEIKSPYFSASAHMLPWIKTYLDILVEPGREADLSLEEEVSAVCTKKGVKS